LLSFKINRIKISINENQEFKYQIDLENINSNNEFFHGKNILTENHEVYYSLIAFKYIKESNAQKNIENYKKQISETLEKQHLHIDNINISKIEFKLENLNYLQEKISNIDKLIHLVQHRALLEMKHPSVIQNQNNNSNQFLKQVTQQKIREIEEIENNLLKVSQKFTN